MKIIVLSALNYLWDIFKYGSKNEVRKGLKPLTIHKREKAYAVGYDFLTKSE